MLTYLICPRLHNHDFFTCLENKNLFQILNKFLYRGGGVPGKFNPTGS